MLKILLPAALLLTMAALNLAAFCKMTNAVCESQNKSWVTIQRCRLRAISRNVTTLNVELELLHPAHNVDLRLELQRRDSTGYKPWIFNYTIDACVFIRQQRHAVFKMFWQIVRDFSTINHNCPYTGKQWVRDFYYDPQNITLPLISGEYGLLLTWKLNKRPQFVTNIYFMYTHDSFKFQF